jgi:hypothetical protein
MGKLREATGENRQVPNLDQRNVATILSMEMRRVVIIKEHLDDNSEKAADLRYGPPRGARQGKPLPVSCQLPVNTRSRGRDQFDHLRQARRSSQPETAQKQDGQATRPKIERLRFPFPAAINYSDRKERTALLKSSYRSRNDTCPHLSINYNPPKEHLASSDKKFIFLHIRASRRYGILQDFGVSSRNYQHETLSPFHNSSSLSGSPLLSFLQRMVR